MQGIHHRTLTLKAERLKAEGGVLPILNTFRAALDRRPEAGVSPLFGHSVCSCFLWGGAVALFFWVWRGLPNGRPLSLGIDAGTAVN